MPPHFLPFLSFAFLFVGLFVSEATISICNFKVSGSKNLIEITYRLILFQKAISRNIQVELSTCFTWIRWVRYYIMWRTGKCFQFKTPMLMWARGIKVEDIPGFLVTSQLISYHKSVYQESPVPVTIGQFFVLSFFLLSKHFPNVIHTKSIWRNRHSQTFEKLFLVFCVRVFESVCSIYIFLFCHFAS